jgi:hypothetical protein
VIRIKEGEMKLDVMFKKIHDEIQKERKKATEKKRKFTGLTEKEIWRKLSKKKTPYIYFQSWGGANAGGTVHYSLGMHNPDSYARSVYVYVFVGPANFVEVVGRAVNAVDTRFPQLIQPKAFGLRIDPGQSETLSFEIAVPADMHPSNYMGNAFLFKPSHHDVGEYMDRGCFIFEVR